MEVLTTERLLLREMHEGDVDFIAGLLADPEVMRFFPRCYTRDEALEWIRRQRERYAAHGFGYWLAESRADGKAVGQVGLVPVVLNNEDVQPALAYIIARPLWRLGLATEAAGACCVYAFDRLGRSRLLTLVRPHNLASLGVARRLGFKPDRLVQYAGFEHLVLVCEPPLPRTAR